MLCFLQIPNKINWKINTLTTKLKTVAWDFNDDMNDVMMYDLIVLSLLYSSRDLQSMPRHFKAGLAAPYYDTVVVAQYYMYIGMVCCFYTPLQYGTWNKEKESVCECYVRSTQESTTNSFSQNAPRPTSKCSPPRCSVFWYSGFELALLTGFWIFWICPSIAGCWLPDLCLFLFTSFASCFGSVCQSL